MGPSALDNWAKALPNLPDMGDYWSGQGGNSYLAQCVRESRYVAAEFLTRLSPKSHGKQLKHLRQAAECYRKEMNLMEEFTRIFPHIYPPSPGIEVEPEQVKRGVEILRELRPLEGQAIRHMKKALKEWETT